MRDVSSILMVPMLMVAIAHLWSRIAAANRRTALLESAHQSTRVVLRLLLERLSETSGSQFTELLQLCDNRLHQQADDLLSEVEQLQKSKRTADAVRLIHARLGRTWDQAHELLREWTWSKSPRVEKLAFIENVLWTGAVEQVLARPTA